VFFVWRRCSDDGTWIFLISIVRKRDGLNIAWACRSDRLVFCRAHSEPEALRRTKMAVSGTRIFFTPLSIRQQLKYQSS